jgi:serine/threonine-protein kinase
MQHAPVDGRYEVSGRLGGGGMAEVYLARDLVLDRDVALKLLRDQYAEDTGFVERFRQEARNAAGLSHPNIVQVYDRGCSGGAYYIAMEYVPGGTLKDRVVGEGPLDPHEAAAIAGQVADALSAAHAKGVVHRDIKPHNVLLAGGRIVKVADFGIARAASSPAVTATSVILGTAAYMSPEQAKGEPATLASDLYSLGVVLYEMLTGRVPYEAQTPVAVAVKHVSEPPRLPRETHPDVPDGLNDITAKLLAKKPEDRYASAAEVADDLRRARRGEAPTATGAAGREARAALEEPTVVLRRGDEGRARGTRRGKRVALWVLAASVALVASLGALAWAVSGYREVTQTPAAMIEEARGAFDGRVVIPNVVGLGRAEAQERLVRAGFEVAIRPRESREADAGEVLGQSLPGGERAEEGAGISLDVGEGPRMVPAPDLSGLTLDEARAVLDEAGLTPGDVNEAPSDTVPEGAVLEQDPPAGVDLEPEARVGLTVSSGPEQPPAPEPAPLAPSSPTPEPAPQQNAAEPYYEPAPAPAPPQYEPVPEPAPAAEPPVSGMPNLSGFPFGGGGDERKGRED